MNPGALRRAATVIAGAWAGVMLCIGAIAAPAAFALLASKDASLLVGRMLSTEAYVGLAVAVALLVAERYRHRRAASASSGEGQALTGPVLLLLGTLFCTVTGHFAILPMLDAARAGQGAVSFATLHGVSAAIFVVKGLLVVALAWRLTRS